MNKTVAITLLCVAIAILVFIMVFVMVNRGFPGSFWGGKNIFSRFGAGRLTDEGPTLEYSAADVKRLEVSFISENVEVSPGKGSEIRIEQTASGIIDDDHKVRANLENGVLTVQSGRYADNLINWDSFFYCSVKIFVPGEYLDSVDVGTVSGEIGYAEVDCPQAHFSSTSGDIAISGLECDDLRTETTSGTLQVWETLCSQLNADSTSGDMQIEAQVNGNVSAETTSGNIRFAGTARVTDMQTVSGEIELETDGSEKIEAQTVSGGVNIEVHDTAALQEIDAETMSGDVCIALPAETRVNLDLTTVSGDTDAGGFDGAVQLGGHEGIQAKVSTVSGDVRFVNTNGASAAVHASPEAGRTGRGTAEMPA